MIDSTNPIPTSWEILFERGFYALLRPLDIPPACEPISISNRLMPYNWQQPDWPEFYYDLSGIEEALFKIAEQTGRASGLLKGLTTDAQLEATIEMVVVEAIKTFAIEGPFLVSGRWSDRFRIGRRPLRTVARLFRWSCPRISH